MTHHASVHRTAPIAIAPKPPRPEPATSSSSSNAYSPHTHRHPQQQHQHHGSSGLSLSVSLHNSLSQGPGASLHAGASRGSRTGTAESSLSASPAARGAVPCQACRSAGTRCIMSDDDGCISCQVSGADCSLVAASPQSRKRKLNGELADDIGKRRSVFASLPSSHACPCVPLVLSHPISRGRKIFMLLRVL